jgi:predicted DNA-binding transcriptional regulator YafY
VHKVEVLDQGFEVPADFDPSEYARSAFGIFGGKPETIELVFPASLAGYIRERNWHESQVLSEEPDGSLRLVLQVAPSFDLKAWVKGFLPHVRVLRPASLREEIAREVEASRGAFPVAGAEPSCG